MSEATVADQPSASAYNVAICRAIAAHEPLEGMRGPDHLAEVFLADDARQSLYNAAILPLIRARLDAASPGGYEFFLTRTAYLDAVVARALRDGVSQIVLLGAGYDTRAYRFSSLLGGARVFELDGRATQQRKLALLAKEGLQAPPQLSYVAADFTRDRLADLLSAAGYTPERSTLFVWEGVTYYLPEAAVDETLRFVREHAPAGSVVCFDYMLPESTDQGRYGASASRALMRAAYSAEPLRFELVPEDVPAFLTQRGFRVLEHLHAADLEERYLTRPDGSLAGAVLDLFGLVRAETAAA